MERMAKKIGPMYVVGIVVWDNFTNIVMSWIPVTERIYLIRLKETF